MSQFRIKNIDSGTPDEWVLRTNDSGSITGDDILAEDPNQLAEAITDTQALLLNATIYSPLSLIDVDHGLFERVKLLEDNVTATTLQLAYENGRSITVTPGNNLVFGSNGEFELDSSGNIKMNPTSMSIYRGSAKMDVAYNGITSGTTNLTFGTTGSTKDALLKSGRDLFLKDGNLVANISLSETGTYTLNTLSQSIVGAINEVNTLVSTVSFQDIYDQSAPVEIITSLARGPFIVRNGSGTTTVPAIQVHGGIECIDFLDVDSLTVGPGSAVNLSISSTGNVESYGYLKSATYLSAPRLQNLSGDLNFQDSRGSANLTQTGSEVLTTAKKSLFGAINESYSVGVQNATRLGYLELEHSALDGSHLKVDINVPVGSESAKYVDIKNSSNVTVFSVNGLGNVVANDVTIGSYGLLYESAENRNHRLGDGTDHAAVSNHLSAANPHGTVSSIQKSGESAKIVGDVLVSPGVGVEIVQSGQTLTISAPSGSTLQGVYNNQADGFLVLDETKNLTINNALDEAVIAFNQDNVTFYKSLVLAGDIQSIISDLNLEITAPGILELNSDSFIIGESGNTASLLGSNVSSATHLNVIPDKLDTTQGYSGSLFGDISEGINGNLSWLTNNIGVSLSAGYPVGIKSNKELVSVYSDVDPVNLYAIDIDEDPVVPEAAAYMKVYGVVDSPSIAHDQAGWIRSNGKVSGTIGAVEVDTNFNPGETLYVAPIGRALISIDSTGSIIGGLLTFTVDSTTITRTINSLSPATTDEHRDNIIKAINDSTAITSTDNFVPKAFISGERATRTVVLTSNLSAGDTVTVNGIILTASVSPSSRLEFEVGPSLFSTILNLTKKINETRDYGATTADAGHKCLAQCNGDCIIIKAIFPGVVANSYVVSSSSAFLTNTGSLLGGTSELTVYKGGRSDLAIALTTTISNITITENWDDFGSSSFLNEFYALSEGESTNRRVKPKYEKLLKVGTVLYYDDTYLETMFSVDIDNGQYISSTKDGYQNELIP